MSSQAFSNKIHPGFQSIFSKVTKAIESVDKNLESDIRWGRLTYGLCGDFHHWICAVAQTKKSLNLIFHFGGLLEDKEKQLISSNSFFFRKLEYMSVDDVDEETIKGFVKQAVSKLDYFKNNWRVLNKTK